MMVGGTARDSGVRVTATDERSGVWAQVTSEDEAWGSDVELQIKDAGGTPFLSTVASARTARSRP